MNSKRSSTHDERDLVRRSTDADPVSPGHIAGAFVILLRGEWFLGFGGGICLAFLPYGENLFARLTEPAWLALIFLWLFTAVLGSAPSVVRHAEHLAVRLGEPYGTLLLTLSVSFVEVASKNLRVSGSGRYDCNGAERLQRAELRRFPL